MTSAFPEYLVMCEATKNTHWNAYRDLHEAVSAARRLSEESGNRYAVYVLASVEMPGASGWS